MSLYVFYHVVLRKLTTFTVFKDFNAYIFIYFIPNIVFTKNFTIIFHHIFSSPELKAQVSFSDRLSSVVCLSVSVCLSVRPSVCKLFLFSTSSQEPLGQFQPKLAQKILGCRGFKFLQMKGPALYQGEIITKK